MSLESDSDKTGVAEQRIGTVVDGRYELLEVIGRGGMGVVYLAEQKNLNRQVVVKVLPPVLMDRPRAIERFDREARRMSDLQHPNIVSTFDYGRDGDLAYICMEHLHGHTLLERLSHGALPLPEFIGVVDQMLDGLGEAHARGMVHRDLKPSNIFLSPNRAGGTLVKLLDFGLAKLVDTSEHLTDKDALAGTPGFVAPEQIESEDVDQRADVYAVGVLMFCMLCGRKPFVADEPMGLLYQHLNEPAPPLEKHLPAGSEAPLELRDLVRRCLAKEPGARPRDADHLRELFRKALPEGVLSGDSSQEAATSDRVREENDGAQSHPGRPTTAGEVEEEAERGGAWRWVAGLSGMLVVASAIGAGLVVWISPSGNEQVSSGGVISPDGDMAVDAGVLAFEAEEERGDRDVGGEAKARVRVEAMEGALVSLNGERQGRPPLALELSPGEHVMTVRRGKRVIQREFDIEAGEDRVLSFAFEGGDEGERVGARKSEESVGGRERRIREERSDTAVAGGERDAGSPDKLLPSEGGEKEPLLPME